MLAGSKPTSDAMDEWARGDVRATQRPRDWRACSLIVFDESAFTRRLVVSILRHAGAKSIETATSQTEALEKIVRARNPILIADWRENTTTGYQIVTALRAMPGALRTTPALLLTGRSNMPDVMAARDAGATEYLLRPLAPQTLMERLDAVLKAPRSFIETESFKGPDRRRARTNPAFAHKRGVDVEAGLTTPVEAIRAQADALSFDMMRRGDLLAARVGRSLRRSMEGVEEITPRIDEVVRLHRATLGQLKTLHAAPAETRAEVVNGLERVAARQSAA
ncbi:MAG: response regulator [Pseudomonadota bacterium]